MKNLWVLPKLLMSYSTTKKLENTLKCDTLSSRFQSSLGSVSDLSLIMDHAGKNETPPLSRDVIGEMWRLVTFLTQTYLCEIKDYLL